MQLIFRYIWYKFYYDRKICVKFLKLIKLFHLLHFKIMYIAKLMQSDLQLIFHDLSTSEITRLAQRAYIRKLIIIQV